MSLCIADGRREGERDGGRERERGGRYRESPLPMIYMLGCSALVWYAYLELAGLGMCSLARALVVDLGVSMVAKHVSTSYVLSEAYLSRRYLYCIGTVQYCSMAEEKADTCFHVTSFIAHPLDRSSYFSKA